VKQKVYIVTEGDYSDYSIRYVCSTREKAEHAKVVHETVASYGNECRIEEWTLDLIDHVDNMRRQGYDVYSVHMLYNNGDNARATVWRYGLSKLQPGYKRCPFGKAPLWSDEVWAKDEKHAIKIANEHRVQHKAEQG